MADELKSAYELAMERLRRKDREDGVVERKPLSAAQKKRIAELRAEAEAKKAELRILRDKRLADAGHDPAKLAEEEEHYQTDLRRIDNRLAEQLREVRGD